MGSIIENNNTGGGELAAKIAAQGDLVRTLKADKKPKEEITAAVTALLALKVRIGEVDMSSDDCLVQAEYKTQTGQDWQPAGGAPAKQEKQKKPAKEVKPKEKVESSD